MEHAERVQPRVAGILLLAEDIRLRRREVRRAQTVYIAAPSIYSSDADELCSHPETPTSGGDDVHPRVRGPRFRFEGVKADAVRSRRTVLAARVSTPMNAWYSDLGLRHLTNGFLLQVRGKTKRPPPPRPRWDDA